MQLGRTNYADHGKLRSRLITYQAYLLVKYSRLSCNPFGALSPQFESTPSAVIVYIFHHRVEHPSSKGTSTKYQHARNDERSIQ